MGSLAKVIELSCDSDVSFDNALKEGIEKANETLRNVKGVWIKDHEVVVEQGRPKLYRLHLKVTFQVER